MFFPIIISTIPISCFHTCKTRVIVYTTVILLHSVYPSEVQESWLHLFLFWALDMRAFHAPVTWLVGEEPCESGWAPRRHWIFWETVNIRHSCRKLNKFFSCLYRASITIKTLLCPTDAQIYNS